MSKFTTVRFGELVYRDEDVIHLAKGLIGLPDLQDWLILDMDDNVPMKWFQSLNRADFGFPVSEAGLFHDHYDVSLGADIVTALANTAPEHITSLIITTVHAGGDRITGNLLAPLVIDVKSMRGVQLNVDNGQYDMRQEINYFKFGLAVQSESGETPVLDSDTVGELSGQEIDSSDGRVPELTGV